MTDQNYYERRQYIHHGQLLKGMFPALRRGEVDDPVRVLYATKHNITYMKKYARAMPNPRKAMFDAIAIDMRRRLTYVWYRFFLFKSWR